MHYLKDRKDMRMMPDGSCSDCVHNLNGCNMGIRELRKDQDCTKKRTESIPCDSCTKTVYYRGVECHCDPKNPKCKLNKQPAKEHPKQCLNCTMSHMYRTNYCLGIYGSVNCSYMPYDMNLDVENK